jgi:hypothetical protein
MCSKTVYPPPPAPAPVMQPKPEVKAKMEGAVSDPKGKKKPGATKAPVAGKRSVRTSAKPGMSSSGVSVGGAGASGLSIPK